ncbi:hypothetical protein [Quadrisphaera sp. DSM 44207]|uniref:hypothetical protein n=1 Tax=Quadrisphaera sp. DSM 44207 TaxID=1881057 RepID=UPI000887616B|nr:hypothetical protein [Quadrisphaera sp. DSM 44207]SDQ06615.1 hypothetical protein SAMN05428996_0312 [Quadrisphaera sp. DSM 44207]
MDDHAPGTAECELLPVARDYDTTYFIQYTPLVYDWDPRRYAIHPGRRMKGSKLGQEAVAGHVAGAREKLRGRPAGTADEFRDLLRAGRSVLGTPWFVNGCPMDNPYWAVGLEFSQTWTSLGCRRGRLIGSVPLTLHPGAKEVSVRSWVRRTATSTVTQSLERASTSELSDEEKWSLSTKKAITRQSGASFNPSATINQVSVPVTGSIPVGVGGNLGISGDISSGANRSSESAREYVHSTTYKTTEALKMARNSTVTEQVEEGTETTTRETTANPNRVNTLNYLYYEVLEELEISTRLSSVDLYLFVPLPVEEVTNRWLLEHECVLKPLVECESLRAGFDAVKQETVHEAVSRRRRAARRDSDGAATVGEQPTGPDPKPIEKTVDRVLETYAKLTGASPESGGGPGSWLYWALVDALAHDVRDALGVLDEQWGAASAEDEEDPAELGALLDQFFTALGPPDDAFLPVDSVVAAITAGAFITSPVVATILLSLELAGIDAAPDDEGLRRRILALQNKYEAFLAPVVEALPPAAPPAPGAGAQGSAGAAPTYAELAQQQLLADAAQAEAVEAEVEARRLRNHVRDHLMFYYQAIWSSWPHATVEEHLRDAGVSDLVEHRFSGFRGSYAACRVLPAVAEERDQIDVGALRADLLTRASAADPRYSRTIAVPTPGVVVEPLLGACEGGDAFVQEHRALDLRVRAAEAERAEQEASTTRLEAERRQVRLDTGDTSDPVSRPATPIGVELLGRPASSPADDS